ncbi:MAG: hypothetical protein JXA43_02755 [Candidatus Diapherotrites archaeon]|nr:hypothetical protein [Candidatus Diapherotrites archaeon]
MGKFALINMDENKENVFEFLTSDPSKEQLGEFLAESKLNQSTFNELTSLDNIKQNLEAELHFLKEYSLPEAITANSGEQEWISKMFEVSAEVNRDTQLLLKHFEPKDKNEDAFKEKITDFLERTEETLLNDSVQAFIERFGASCDLPDDYLANEILESEEKPKIELDYDFDKLADKHELQILIENAENRELSKMQSLINLEFAKREAEKEAEEQKQITQILGENIPNTKSLAKWITKHKRDLKTPNDILCELLYSEDPEDVGLLQGALIEAYPSVPSIVWGEMLKLKEEDHEKLAGKHSKTKKAPRIICKKCGTLLEIRNPKRPLNVRCPNCEWIDELDENSNWKHPKSVFEDVLEKEDERVKCIVSCTKCNTALTLTGINEKKHGKTEIKCPNCENEMVVDVEKSEVIISKENLEKQSLEELEDLINSIEESQKERWSQKIMKS